MLASAFRARSRAAVLITSLAILVCAPLSVANAQGARAAAPWQNSATALIVDVRGENPLDFDALEEDRRIVGVMHKASEGLSSHAVEIYRARRAEAKKRGYLWGSYHVLTRSDPRAQVALYVGQLGAPADEVMAIEVQCLGSVTTCPDPNYAVTPDDLAAAMLRIKELTGRFPLVSVNHASMRVLDRRFGRIPELDGAKLWYPRYKDDISGVFPKGYWGQYALWRFSSAINCSAEQHAAGACPYQAPGTDHAAGISVYFGPRDQLRRTWPAL
ncbi:MAG: hypothetical protein AAFW46_11625 [Pseudomonadota bacterium]